MFDPFTASVADWKAFLLTSETHERDYSDMEDWPLPSRLEKQIRSLRKAKLLYGQREQIVRTAVDAALSVWDFLADYQINIRTGGTHPFTCLPMVACVGDNPEPTLVSITQLLWWRAPRVLDYEDKGFFRLVDGFKAHVPIDNNELEQIYRDHFQIYKFCVLEILLLRGEHAQANELFLERVTDFPDVDPLCMDHLIYLGLPMNAAEVWLQQGLNGEPSHSNVRSHARKRWKKVAERRPDPVKN